MIEARFPVLCDVYYDKRRTAIGRNFSRIFWGDKFRFY